MKSKLFSKLAALPGINIFNHSQKIEYTTPSKRIEPQESHSYHKLYHMSTQYFQDLVVQDKYIKTIKKLLDEYSFEVEKWDLIQTHHEAEVDLLKQEHKKAMANTKTGQLQEKINQLEAKNRRLENRVADLEKQTGKAVISNTTVENLNATLLLLTNKIYSSKSKEANNIRIISSKIHSFFNKIRNKEVEIINEP